MESIKLAKRLQGLWTLDLIEEKLGIKRSTAIKIISHLRKEGFVYTKGGGKQRRLYEISPWGFKKEWDGIYDIINKYSKVKLVTSYEHKIIGRKLTIEETIARAIATKEYRTILASLGLFNYVKDWFRLYNYAKEYNICHDMGALYDAARTIIRVKRMNNRIRSLLRNHKEKGKFIIEGLKSKDFIHIEEYWNVKIPLNKADLMRYKEY